MAKKPPNIDKTSLATDLRLRWRLALEDNVHQAALASFASCKGKGYDAFFEEFLKEDNVSSFVKITEECLSFLAVCQEDIKEIMDNPDFLGFQNCRSIPQNEKDCTNSLLTQIYAFIEKVSNKFESKITIDDPDVFERDPLQNLLEELDSFDSWLRTSYLNIPYSIKTHTLEAFSAGPEDDASNILSEDLRIPIDAVTLERINLARISHICDDADNELSIPAGPQPAEKKNTVRWGDLSEDDELVSQLQSLTNYHASEETASKTREISVPRDLETSLPYVYIIIKKWCAKYNYVLSSSENSFARDGFKYRGIYNNLDDNAPFKRLNVLARQSLTDINTLFSLLARRPDVELALNDKSAPATYALYLIFKKIKMTSSTQRHCKISMKNGDAGEALLKSRFYSMFDTGSSCVNELWKSFHIMFLTMVEKEKDSTTKDFLEVFQDKCFTSTQGMLANSYTTVRKKTMAVVESRGRNGRPTRTKQAVERLGKDVPVMALGKAPFKEIELTKLETLKNNFNDFGAVVDAVDKQIKSKNTFQKAIIVEEVTKLAYNKIGTLRKLIKRRKGAIREEISREKKEVNQINWLAAQATVLDSDKDIDVPSLDLTWDINKLVREISPLVARESS